MTLAEALQYAASRLDAATAAMTAIRDQIAQQLAATTNSTQTIINNFINRPAVTLVYIDVNNGVDAAGYGTIDKPFKTFDYAATQIDATRPTTMYLLTDIVINTLPGFQGTLSLVGISKTPGPLGQSFSYASRKVTFAAESSQSPAAGLGRVPGKLSVYNLRTFYVDFAMPELPSGIDYPYHIEALGGSVNINTSTITVATAASAARFLVSNGGQRTTVTMTAVALGANVPGKLFAGVASGANPNSSFTWETNITAA